MVSHVLFGAAVLMHQAAIKTSSTPPSLPPTPSEHDASFLLLFKSWRYQAAVWKRN